jgi:hypothetical protein
VTVAYRSSSHLLKIDGAGEPLTGGADYAVIVGGASAALVGLLFVAVSIKVDVIVRSVALRARAALFLVRLGD